MAKLLKNLYHKEFIATLANDIRHIYSPFNQKRFISNIFNNTWEEKELKQRMRHIAISINNELHLSYVDAVNILQKCFIYRQKNSNNRVLNLGLENMIFQDFVEVYGVNCFKESMQALESFTQNSSSEFAIRQFILKYEDKTFDQLKLWTKSNSEHTRRLSSEGCRPRLPWAIALPLYKKDPSKVIEILELLKNDKSKYVQKSVANCLNDISKDNIDLVKQLSKKWIHKSDNLDWIIKHGCRTLLKAGDKDILELFGFKYNKKINITNISFDKKVHMGEDFNFSFELSNKKDFGNLRIEYTLNFLRQNKKYSRKVFKISESNYNKSHLNISKKYSFKKISTRVYYKGPHSIEFIVNGQSIKKCEFILI